MTYDEAIACLGTLTNYERAHEPEAMRAVPLSRMRWVCEQLGSPQRTFRSVLVAGTNAKGSICAMIYAMLRCAGLRVGLYTSPHLADVRERIRVSGDPSTPPPAGGVAQEGEDWISPEELAMLIERLQPVIEASKTHAEGPVTYFEVVTAAALLHFAKRRVRIGVLEVGLGGRLDATNVVEQDVSVFGPIGFDHMDVLGPTLSAIAKEKAGIVSKEDAPRGRSARAVVISARQSPEVARVLEEAVASKSPLFSYGRELTSTVLGHEPDGMRVTVQGLQGTYEGLRLPLIGRHQAENAALAVASVEALAGGGAPHDVVRRGLAQVRWPGRCEVIRGEPLVVLDGAHNPQAGAGLVDARSSGESRWWCWMARTTLRRCSPCATRWTSCGPRAPSISWSGCRAISQRKLSASIWARAPRQSCARKAPIRGRLIPQSWRGNWLPIINGSRSWRIRLTPTRIWSTERGRRGWSSSPARSFWWVR